MIVCVLECKYDFRNNGYYETKHANENSCSAYWYNPRTKYTQKAKMPLTLTLKILLLLPYANLQCHPSDDQQGLRYDTQMANGKNVVSKQRKQISEYNST